MSTISVSNISDGDAVTAASVNNQVNTVVNDYNGNITDANIASAAAITASKLAGGTAGMFGAQISFSPTITTGGVVGNGTLTGTYVKIGKMVFGQLKYLLGSTSTVGTNIAFSAPVTGKINDATFPVGQVYDNAGGIQHWGIVRLDSTNALTPVWLVTSTAYGEAVGSSSTIPSTWANTQSMFLSFTYEAA